MSYSLSAIRAARLASDKNLSPEEAWRTAVRIEFPNSISSQEKCCPKNAFLGLCEEGVVKGVPGAKYTKSIQNKLYAVTAIKFLDNWRHSTLSAVDLWTTVLKNLNENPTKRHNSQMNVVLALWDEGLLNIK